MKPNGVGYLVVDNRWTLVEPNLRLAFLSWLRRVWRAPYLRGLSKSQIYDCEAPQMRQPELMLDAADVPYRNVGSDARCETLEIEQPDSMGAYFLRVTRDASWASIQQKIFIVIYQFLPTGAL